MTPRQEIELLVTIYSKSKYQRVAACFSDMPFWQWNEVGRWFKISRKRFSKYTK